jgi:DNA-binding transcriptional regulator YiaG
VPNIKTVFQAEMARVARKETSAEIKALRQANTQQRSHIAALRREVQALAKQMKRLAKGATPPRGAAQAQEDSDGDARQIRFSAQRLAAHRQRLGLSAAAVAKLLGVSALSVYKWESGKTRPRAKQLQAIAALRTLGKREAAARLVELE